MRFHQFDLNLLVYLDALLTDKSVSKAAARVHITQPAMSEALARLRAYYGDQLLVTVAGRAMVLTPLAQSLVTPVRNLLTQAQSVAGATANFDPKESNRVFSIMSSDYAMDVLLKQLLPRLCKEAPAVRLEMRRLTLGFFAAWEALDGRQQLKRAELDLLIAPDVVVLKEFPSEVLWEDTVACLVWSKNRQVGNKISIEQYFQMGHVASSHDEHIDEFFARLGGVRRTEVVLPDMGAVLAALEGTNRIATVHRRHAQLYAKHYSLRLIEAPVEFPRLVECMQWHPHQDRDPGLIWFRNYIQRVVNEA